MQTLTSIGDMTIQATSILLPRIVILLLTSLISNLALFAQIQQSVVNASHTADPGRDYISIQEGFVVRTFQAEAGYGYGNNYATAESYLDGRLIECVEEWEGPPPRFESRTECYNCEEYEEVRGEYFGVVNWAAGHAGSAGFAGFFANDELVPSLASGPNLHHFVAEILTALELQAGVTYRFGVNSDDGFRAFVGSNPKSAFAKVVGNHDGGRWTGETVFELQVQASGLYPIRLVWWSDTAPLDIEFYSIDPQTSNRTLVNDPQGGVRGYLFESALPYVAWVSPEPGRQGVDPANPIAFNVALDGAHPAVASPSLTIDGASQTLSSKSEPDGSQTLSWAPSQPLGSQSSPIVIASAQATDVHGSWVTLSVAWTFAVAEYAFVPGWLGTSSSSVDPALGGMRWKTYQADPLNLGTIQNLAEAEAVLAGSHGPSSHDPDGEYIPGFFEVSHVNFAQDPGAREAGRFTSHAVVPYDIPDMNIPGIPGLSGSDDRVVGEARAFLHLAQAGIHRMVVNSDDGFELAVGRDIDGQRRLIHLGSFDGGRGAADSVIYFDVESPGVYFFRLIWFEGIGGANVEWSSMDPYGCRSLINSCQPNAIPAYLERGAAEPLPVGISTFSHTLQRVEIEFDTRHIYTAPDLDGPWSVVPNATSPYVVPVGLDKGFYRAGIDNNGGPSIAAGKTVGSLTRTLTKGKFHLWSNPFKSFDLNELLPVAPDAVTVQTLQPSGTVQSVWVPGSGWMPSVPVNTGQTLFIQYPGPAAFDSAIMMGEVVEGVIQVTLHAGDNWLGVPVPVAGQLETDLGYPTLITEAVELLDVPSQTYDHSVRLPGVWAPVEPAIPVGVGFFTRRTSGGTWTLNVSLPPLP